MNKLLDQIFELRETKKKAVIVKAVIEEYEVGVGSDGEDLYIPIIGVEGLGRFKYGNGSISSGPEYCEGNEIDLYLDENDISQSIMVRDPIEGVLIFISLLLGFGVPFFVVLKLFG